ncbi:MAG: ABC transporter permease [Clostridium sp.]|nr:ABC transporter permease [Clostridium sp.]
MNIKPIYFSLKNLNIYYFVPLIVLYVFIPILNIGMINMSKNIENAYTIIFREAEKYIPITSLWWITFIFKEYIEGDGNELLYCIEDSGKVKVHHIVLIFTWYIMHVSILFLVYSLFWDNVFLEFIKTVIQCFFFTSLLYLLIYTLKSTTISFMLLLIYELLATFMNFKCINYISIFENGMKVSLETIITKYSIFLLLGILFLIIGIYKNKRFYF